MVTKGHKSSNISIFQNETGVLDNFRGFGAFWQFSANETLLNSDSCSASQNTRRDMVV